ncbi:MAG TPA: Crp/Fnr family transcriptional regulator [Puia sp.]|jgi:CRP-like cAMP-binding protein
MYRPLREYLKNKATLSENEIERIEFLAIPKQVRRKQLLLREGDVCRHHTFICEGIMRLYRTDAKANEHILKFAVEGWWVSDRESLMSGEPAKSNIEALEKTQVLQWTKENFDLLCREIPAFRAMYDQLLAKAIEAIHNRVFDNISMSAEEKYMHFIKKYPDILNRVPLHMVASYLGITRETLTRVRNHFLSGPQS